MKDFLKILAVVAACIALALFIRRDPNPPGLCPAEVTAKSDTIIIRDTIYIPNPTLAEAKTLAFARVTLPVWKPNRPAPDTIDDEPVLAELATEEDDEAEPPDSASVVIPIEQRHYQGDDYDAWVSGWNPSLDSLQIYRPTQRIETTVEVTRFKTRRWGISGGVGVVVTPKGGIQPGLFVGASYTFFAF